MDCDAEFNALASMYQSVVQDMKVMYPAWENVSQKALKLASQLKTTLSCMSAFVDAIQSVGDAANNLKGATRDMGACLTRVCMRQRSIENRLRSLADALTDELALSIQNKGSQWKQRISEMDRHASKFCRKVRSHKGGIDVSAVSEQRRICYALLVEQRNQLSFFISALLPVLNNELCVLEESAHVRQVAEHLHSTVRSVDACAMIETILSDIHQGADYSWRNCISLNANRTSYVYNNDDVSLRAPSPSPTTFTWPTSLPGGQTSAVSSMRAHTISVVEQPRRGKLNAHTFSPPSPSQQLPLTKPPLPKRNVSSSSSVSSVLPDFNETQSEQVTTTPQRNGNAYASSSDVSREAVARRPSRPLSFACDERAIFGSPQCRSVPSGTHFSSMASNSSEYQANSLIAETIQQIDKLGSELDSYCKSAQATPLAHQVVRLRSGSCKPAPPERRSSTITSATASAPSVADVRASCEYASSRGSSTDLNRDPFSSRFL
uniref:IMD domain-containing protein n=2 Tax=Parascaris univalens TaxID=6257 RepID=A0A915BVP2_PARUN